LVDQLARFILPRRTLVTTLPSCASNRIQDTLEFISWWVKGPVWDRDPQNREAYKP